MQKKQKLDFSKQFLWGAAISAHQVEGGNHNQWSVWEKQNAKSLAAQAVYQYGDLENWKSIEKLAVLPANYISGKAANHYELYEADFDLLQQMNMNALRFSIEWSRIEPEEGAWNVEALDHYKQYAAELKKRGIEPIVTLFHFTLPVWFDQKGGFEKASNIDYFVRFAEKVVEELKAHVRFVITINEPTVYAGEGYESGHWPPNVQNKRAMVTVLRNLAKTHNKTAKALKRINTRIKVSVAYNSTYVYAGDDALLSRMTAHTLQYFVDDYFLSKVAKNCDFLGINYYFSNRVYGYRVHNPDQELSDLGWDLAPENLEHCLVRLHDKYKLPIMITENGIADADDAYRQKWLTKTISAMQAAQDHDVKLLGYLHWSLLDNFEWDKGRWPRFGLVEVDYRTYERRLRPSAVWYGKVIKMMRKGKTI